MWNALLPGSLQQLLQDRLKACTATVVANGITSHPTPSRSTCCTSQPAAKGHKAVFRASLVLGQSYSSNLYIMFSLISCSVWTLMQRQFSLPLGEVNIHPLVLCRKKTPVKKKTFYITQAKQGTSRSGLTVMTISCLETCVFFLVLPHIHSVNFCTSLKI